MERIYLDNASTSYPKAPGVVENMRLFMEEIGCNVGRGGYAGAYSAGEVVYDTRERLCRLFHAPKPQNVIFTSNITASLNFIIKGMLRPGDHVLVSSMEHNAMMRPLVQMEKLGVSFDRIPCNSQGMLLLDQVEGLIRPNTRAILMLHASNVCGTVMPIREVGAICHKHGLRFVVDAAQTAGVFPIDIVDMHIDALAFTGHKSLLGPQGIGGFIIEDSLAAELDPLISGGTGSRSDSEEVPDFLPDRFEGGTMNLPGIFGLNASLQYLEKEGIGNILQHEQTLSKRFSEGLAAFDCARIAGTEDPMKRAPVVSVDFTGHDNAEIAFLLDSQYGIMTRCGLHCAPSAHKTLGTFPQGTVRFSIGPFNTPKEIDFAVDAIKAILSTY